MVYPNYKGTPNECDFQFFHTPFKEITIIDHIAMTSTETSTGTGTSTGTSTFQCSEIIPGKLFLGVKKFAQNQKLLKTKEISAIVNLTEVPLFFSYDSSEQIPVHWVPIKDTEDQGIEWIEDAAIFIDSQLKANKRVFVHCVMGISRSPTLIIYYLMTRNSNSLECMNLREALEFVLSKRSIIRPNNGFIKALIDFEKTHRGSSSMTEDEYGKFMKPLRIQP